MLENLNLTSSSSFNWGDSFGKFLLRGGHFGQSNFLIVSFNHHREFRLLLVLHSCCLFHVANCSSNECYFKILIIILGRHLHFFLGFLLIFQNLVCSHLDLFLNFHFQFVNRFHVVLKWLNQFYFFLKIFLFIVFHFLYIYRINWIHILFSKILLLFY